MEKLNTVTIGLDYYNKLHSLEEANMNGVFISHNIVWQPNEEIKSYHKSVKEEDVINIQVNEINKMKSEIIELKEELYQLKKRNFLGFKF